MNAESPGANRIPALTMDRSQLSEAELSQLKVALADLGGAESLAIAYSGGVDSTVLLALAVEALGPSRVKAILGISPSLPESERIAAHDVADLIGADVIEVETHEGDRPEYIANGPDRCFFCKDELFSMIDDSVLERHALDAVAYGENADDAKRPDRPGSRAATNHRVLRPLATAGIDKQSVRNIARAYALPNAEKPAAPCLASRIPHLMPVTREKLGQIEKAEHGLKELGFADVRVRHHDTVARVEFLETDLVKAVSDPLREQVQAAVKAAGFQFVAADLKGIQSGAFTLPLVGVTS